MPAESFGSGPLEKGGEVVDAAPVRATISCANKLPPHEPFDLPGLMLVENVVHVRGLRCLIYCRSLICSKSRRWNVVPCTFVFSEFDLFPLPIRKAVVKLFDIFAPSSSALLFNFRKSRSTCQFEEAFPQWLHPRSRSRVFRLWSKLSSSDCGDREKARG